MPKQNKAKSKQLLQPFSALSAKSLIDLGDGEEADHTPIIVTGDSVKIDLSSEEYSSIPGIYTSSGINLHLIECLHATHRDGSNLCYFVRSGELCTIVFHCTRTDVAGEKNVIIQGGLTTSPSIIFDLVEYLEDAAAPNDRKVHFNADRKIVAMEIFRTRGGLTERVHLCPLIPADGKCQYRIWDPHD